MNKPSEPLFTTRPTVTIELPLDKHTRILHPEQIILKISDHYHDIGALCYVFRSDKRRRHGQPREVVTNSLLKQRPKQILHLIKAISSLKTNSGRSLETVSQYAHHLKLFTDSADANGQHNCLAGGEATRIAFRAWAIDTQELYKRQKFGEMAHNLRLTNVCELLEAATGLQDLMQDIRKVKRRGTSNGGTEPLALHDFAHAVALNQCLFDGLCDLVLDHRPFPYKLNLPNSLGWAQNHLWLFPTTLWRLPSHLRDDAIRAKSGSIASWPYDYINGRMATLDEIEHRYNGQNQANRRKLALGSIRRAQARLDEANTDAQNAWRLTLGMHALRAFMFLFYCNTGSNEQVVQDHPTTIMRR